MFPARQLDERNRPIEGLGDIVALFEDAYAAWLWLTAPRNALDGEEPLAVLARGQRDRVIDAAEGHLQEKSPVLRPPLKGISRATLRNGWIYQPYRAHSSTDLHGPNHAHVSCDSPKSRQLTAWGHSCAEPIQRSSGTLQHPKLANVRIGYEITLRSTGKQVSGGRNVGGA